MGDGGSAGMLSSNIVGTRVMSSSHRQNVKLTMTEFLADSKYSLFDDLIEKSCDVIRSQMNTSESTVEAIRHSLFFHTVVVVDNQQLTVLPTVSSTFMWYYASFLLEQHTSGTLSVLRTLLTNSGIRNLFERHVLKTVVEKYKSEVSLGDCALLENGELGIPSVTNFLLVDFVIKPYIEGQMTVGKSHCCASSRHAALEEAMGRERIRDRNFVFLCDKSNYDFFCNDNNLLGDVKQYKMLVSWTAKRKRPEPDRDDDQDA